MESVKCNVCGKIFTNCFSAETNQAFGCASDFFCHEKTSYILSSYGSSFDTTRFIVEENSKHHHADGTICDSCIEGLVESKDIKEDPNFNYWANIK
jgi:hypothetical protein